MKKLKWKKDDSDLVTYVEPFETQFTIYDANTDEPWLSARYQTGETGTMSYSSWGHGAFRPKKRKFKTVAEIKEAVQEAYEIYARKFIKQL